MWKPASNTHSARRHLFHFSGFRTENIITGEALYITYIQHTPTQTQLQSSEQKILVARVSTYVSAQCRGGLKILDSKYSHDRIYSEEKFNLNLQTLWAEACDVISKTQCFCDMWNNLFPPDAIPKPQIFIPDTTSENTINGWYLSLQDDVFEQQWRLFEFYLSLAGGSNCQLQKSILDQNHQQWRIFIPWATMLQILSNYPETRLGIQLFELPTNGDNNQETEEGESQRRLSATSHHSVASSL